MPILSVFERFGSMQNMEIVDQRRVVGDRENDERSILEAKAEDMEMIQALNNFKSFPSSDNDMHSGISLSF